MLKPTCLSEWVMINVVSFVMLLLSFGVESFGGLYTHSYIINNDMYRLSDLQGTGGNDFVLLIIGSGLLLLLLTFINAFYFLKTNTKSVFFLISIGVSWWVFELMETASFINISYATVLFGDNIVFSIWFGLFVLLILLVLSSFEVSF